MQERRRQPRNRKVQPHNLQVHYQDTYGQTRVVMARLADVSDGGIGVETDVALGVGSVVSLSGELQVGQALIPLRGPARVAFSLARGNGAYRFGLFFEDPSMRGAFSDGSKSEQEPARNREAFVDYYEVLQISPNADIDMIHRVYRLLAQRYHPDNKESGDEEAFKGLLKAYRILSDSEQRAAYDMEHRSARKLRWKIFERPQTGNGMAAEKKKRQAILTLLYNKRMYEPEQPAMTLLEFEELLGCPREQLDFCLWYLKENGWIIRGDHGRHVITAKGVDELEAHGIPEPPANRLLTEGETVAPANREHGWASVDMGAVATA